MDHSHTAHLAAGLLPDAHLITMGFVKWVEVAVIVWWVGFLGFWWFVLRTGLSVLPESDRRAVLGLECEAYLRRWMGIGIALLAGISILGMAHRAVMISRRPFLDSLSVWPTILLQTQLGRVWLLKMGLLLIIGLVWRFGPARTGPQSGLRLGYLLCFTVALSGHAANQGVFSAAVAADGLHLIVVSLWIGGLAQFRLFVRPVLIRMSVAEAHSFLTELVARFSRLAVTCVILLFVTGVYGARFRLWDLDSLWTTPYGATFSAKLILVGWIVGLGGLGRFYILPGLRRAQRLGEAEGLNADSLRRRFFILVAVELTAALAVLAMAALLTQTPPPRRPFGP
jgi:putative copper export protein